MAEKSAYFYEIKLYDDNDKEIKIQNLKLLYDKIFKKYCKNNSLELDNSIDNKVNMDIIIDREDLLFCKFGKEKDNTTVQVRDNETRSTDLVILPKDLNKKILEVYTYFLLDYKEGIVSIIHGQSAPTKNMINNIASRYSNKYRTELEPIYSIDTYKKLYKKKSKLSKFLITLNQPNEQIIKAILGDKVGRGKMLEYLSEGKKKVILEVSAKEGKRYITDDYEEIPEYLQPLIDSFTMNAELNFRGSSQGNKIQNFGIGKKELKYNTSINTYKIEDKKRVYYNQKEINDEYYDALKESYRINKNDIMNILNR